MNIEARPLNMLSEGIMTFFCFDADQHFDTKGVVSWPHFGSNLLLYKVKLQSNARNMPGEGWAVLELTGT